MTKLSSKAGGCPVCGKPAVEKYSPFCSPRCKNVDLHRWLGEVYVVPSEEVDEDEADSLPTTPND